MKNIFFTVLALGIALSISAQRVYINPGHGDWGPNSRPMATVPFPNLHATTGGPDTLGFYESNTNLWKAFALNEKLQGAGYTTMMSRTENGPYPYVYGDESIDKPLLDICAEVNLFEADYFISIHSNANVDGDNVNYPLIIHSGYDGAGFRDERNMALHTWPRLFEAFGNDKDDKNIEQGFEPNSAYAADDSNVRGSISFYGYNLSTLLHDYQGYLVEGYFHTYQPARHRALNPEWCRQEGIRYFRGIQDYYDKSGENVGYIMGCVRSLTEMSHHLFNSMSTSYDEFLPINGAKVVLRDASGNIIRTECYRHVDRKLTDQYYYTTDNNYNGIFVFEDLQQGTYTLSVHAAGYQDTVMEVKVVADKTVYPEIFLEKGQGTEPQINVDIKWVLDGGTVDGQLPQTITEEYTLPTPSKAGYIFRGWYDNAEGTGTALTTLPIGYKGTLYAKWRAANVKWELNGGHISENKLLWEDFQKNKLKNNSLVSIENALEVINDVGGEQIYKYLSEVGGEYKWLGDYLWNKASGIEQGLDAFARWGIWLNTFLNCTTYTVNGITLDFTESGKYDSWKSWATEEIRQKVTLPNQITSPYTIPTPEKEGATFQGWYDNPNGTGTALTTLPAGYEGTVYAIWVGPVPCIVAYDLTCNYKEGQMAFDFSFYANTQPASGKLIFYNEKGQPTEEIELSNLRQGKNTVFIQVKDIPEFEVGQDIFWEVYLEARPSTLFSEIFRSKPFNTAYATIDNSPESDFFGSIWVASQEAHGYNTTTDGEIWRLVPELAYARDGGKDAEGHRPHRPGESRPNGDGQQPPRWDGQQPPQGGGGQPQGGGQPPRDGQPQGGGQPPRDGQPQGGGGKQEPPRGGQPDHTPTDATQGGFEVIFRPTVAPDGKVYLTDNGPSYGGVFVMDPHTKQITNFFEGCDYLDGEWIKNGTVVGSGSTGAHIYCTENEAKLYLIRNTHHPDAANGAGQALGFFEYNLMNNGELQHTYNNTMAYKAFANGYLGTLTDYAIVGTSHGIWVCNLRIENVSQEPSLRFYSNDGMVTYFEDSTFISGSWGAALAVNHDETILVMVDRYGDLLQFDIEWTGDVPNLTNKQIHEIFDFTSDDNYNRPTITTLNFDYAGNLVATIGETYNDASDQHMVTIYTMPKAENNIRVPARYSHRVPSLVEDEQCTSLAKPNAAYETVELYRKLQKGMYNTICLPFAIPTLKGTPYQGASVLKFVGTTTTENGGEKLLHLNFSPVTFNGDDIMQAGVPYLIQPQEDIANSVFFYDVTSGNEVEAQQVEKNGIIFQGVMGPTELNDPYMLMLVANNRLAKSTGGQMLGNRGYFVVTDPQNMPKRSVLTIVETPTGYNDIYHNANKPMSYKIVENGHIWIIRGGERYNLMGVKVN